LDAFAKPTAGIAMEDEPRFAFEKKLGISEQLYGDPKALVQTFERLLYCMKETNTFYRVTCEFLRLDFRQPYIDEQMQFPIGSLILDMKWGSRTELDATTKTTSEIVVD
jgi:hypothetical protein